MTAEPWDWEKALAEMMAIPVDYEAIYGHPLPDGYLSWDDYILNRPRPERQAAQLLTGQEP